ncbi:uncharacterized protein LOC123699220 [Colias croceus]|uniref:uncharacterized protein LOC123699220 n=1 Tax=Colias crocea TaxID=72248 RepID=UPI001E27D5AE|nr:uncharacterized protein LOC123699220 [Colias croceus]
MSGHSSPLNGGYDAAEPAMRLSVRKDLFPDERLPKIVTNSDSDNEQDQLEDYSCVKLETDFEQSIDDIANQKMQVVNGIMPSAPRSRHKKHKQRSRRDSDQSTLNGYLPSERKRKKHSRSSRSRTHKSNSVVSKIKGGKNLNLVSSSECQEDEDEEDSDAESESSEDEVLQSSVKLKFLPRQSGKPYSHELSQLSTKKKSKDSSKEQRTHVVIPCSGKPRSMLGLCSSRSKKKSKKPDRTPTYRSQIVDSSTKLKIKIKRTGIEEAVSIVAPTPTIIADIVPRKSKKKRAASPAPSVSSGEEYDPTRGDTAAAMSVAAPKPRQSRQKAPRKSNNNTKSKAQKTEKSRSSAAESRDAGPQSPWATSMPEEILTKIFEYVVIQQGTLPAIVRLSSVCKFWHSVSCKPEFWRNVDLAQYTVDKCKTDYKLVWLLENRLSQCQSLNIAQWDVCNVTWVLTCLVDYCPDLVELGVAGWSRITPEQLFDMIQGLPKLQRIDLSSLSELGSSSTCLSAASVARIMENFGNRLTHLTLANNKFSALQQTLTSVATYCPNLEVLDISGALATSHPAAVPLEALQKGCPKLRVFRAANAQLVLANATTSQQMEAGGWAQLEELSIAGGAAAERTQVGEYRFGEEALARLVRGATRLRLLDLRGLHRLTDSGLVRVPAWDLQHLFLGGCNVTRQRNACLELICEKWSHSLIELDLSWASANKVLDDAVAALADAATSKLRILNLFGSSVSLEPVKKVLLKCSQLESLNLSLCRALPRGMKRLYTGKELQDLKDSFDTTKVKKEGNKEHENKKGKKSSKAESSKSEDKKIENSDSVSESSSVNLDIKSPESKSSSCVFQEPRSVSDASTVNDKLAKLLSPKDSSDFAVAINEAKYSSSIAKLSSPLAQSKPDSSCTPRSDPLKAELGSPHYSPVQKPDSQVPSSPDVQSELVKTNSSWNIGPFKRTPNHKSEASPLNRLESHNKIKQAKVIEQCSPTTSLENKRSPETLGVKPDIKNPNSWNYGSYSPMPRQDNQFSSQRSPYSAQPSPAQPSPYSTQPSPYSTQPSPYSSQPSPYSAQPSPDTSQMVKTDLQKSNAWNTGNFSPLPKHHAPFSPHPSTHNSPDPGLGVKNENLRSNPNKTPGQYSPMSRPQHHSPYSPRPSVDNSYSNKKSPVVAGKYSPMMRSDCHLPSPDGGHAARPHIAGRGQEIYGRAVTKAPEVVQNIPPPDMSNSWGLDRFSQMSTPTAGIESLVWGSAPFGQARLDSAPQWGPGARRGDAGDPWALGQFRIEPPHQLHNTFVEQSVSFDSLSAHVEQQAQLLAGYLEDGFPEPSRVD